MDDITFTRHLLQQGLDSQELRRLRAAGELERVRRGAYAPPAAAALTPEDRHLRLIMATWPQLRREAVLSHGSAAVLHGLPIWEQAVPRVHLTRPRAGGGVRRTTVQIHSGELPATDVTVRHGLPVTSLARTVADLARSVPFEQAVAAGDHALAHGLSAGELAAVLAGQQGWRGVSHARQVAAFLDPRSESAGESVSRVRFHRWRLPAPELQFEIWSDGVLVARSDFGWEAQRTLGEFDGKVKYGRLLRPGESPSDAVYREKRREDALRDLDWQVVRWNWADLHEPGALRDRLLRAFARGTRTAA